MIAIASLLISTITFIFYYREHNREKYLIVSDYLKQLMDWHSQTVETLILLRQCVKNNENKNHLLCKLSAQIEKGRFYFPNIDKKDNFGLDKPIAYQGYRNLTLDFLVCSYNLFLKNDATNYLKHAEMLQREFTSIVFQVVRPKDNLQNIKKLTDKFYASEEIFIDYLDKDPKAIQLIRHIT